VSETTETIEAAPKRYRIMAPYIQYRRKNVDNRRFGTHVSPWMIEGGHQGAIISSDLVHPDDLAHLLRTTFPVRVIRDRQIVREEQPMLVELPAS
jgi:hypothetical protein